MNEKFEFIAIVQTLEQQHFVLQDNNCYVITKNNARALTPFNPYVESSRICHYFCLRLDGRVLEKN